MELRTNHSIPKKTKKRFLFIALIVLLVCVVLVSIFIINKDNSQSDPTAFETYQRIHKALYVWSHTTQLRTPDGSIAWRVLLSNRDGDADYLLQFLLKHGFTSVYLFIGSVEWEWNSDFGNGKVPEEDNGLPATVRTLQDAGIEVHFMVYLNDDPDDMTNWSRMGQVAAAVQGFSSRHSLPIASLHIDCEPNDQSNWPDLLRLVNASSSVMATSLALKPVYTRTPMALPADISVDPRLTTLDNGLFASQLLALCNGTATSAVMAYSNDWGTVERLASQGGIAAEAAGCELRAAIETGFVNGLPAEETLCWVLRDDKAGWFPSVVALQGDLEGNMPSFQELVVHDYSQYVYDLYCEDPIARPSLDHPYLNCSYT